MVLPPEEPDDLQTSLSEVRVEQPESWKDRPNGVEKCHDSKPSDLELETCIKEALDLFWW